MYGEKLVGHLNKNLNIYRLCRHMYSVCMYITENKYSWIKLIFLIMSVIIIILMILINTLFHEDTQCTTYIFTKVMFSKRVFNKRRHVHFY